MSLRALFGSVIAKLRLRKNDSVQALAEELYAALTSDEPIVLSSRIVIHNPTNGPAISIVNTGNTTHEGIEVVDKDGHRVMLGIGHGSAGIYASNIQYRPEFKSDPNAVQDLLSQLGNRGGKTTLSPNTTEETTGTPAGPGVVSSTGFTSDGVGSGYSYPDAGSGVPGLVNDGSSDYVPVPGLGEMLGSVQLSTRDGHGGAAATHPPDAAVQMGLNGNPVWWPKDMHSWMINRCTVNVDYGDWLECTRFGIGDTIRVAKPYYLQKTPFDGETIDGVAYAYTNNQCRTATVSGPTVTTEVVTPEWIVKSGSTPGDIIYVRWVSNGTNVMGQEYIDINVDSRSWIVNASGCTTASNNSGTGSCPGGACVFTWNSSTEEYENTSNTCSGGYGCPEPPAPEEYAAGLGSPVSICCLELGEL